MACATLRYILPAFAGPPPLLLPLPPPLKGFRFSAKEPEARMCSLKAACAASPRAARKIDRFNKNKLTNLPILRALGRCEGLAEGEGDVGDRRAQAARVEGGRRVRADGETPDAAVPEAARWALPVSFWEKPRRSSLFRLRSGSYPFPRKSRKPTSHQVGAGLLGGFGRRAEMSQESARNHLGEACQDEAVALEGADAL